MERGEFTGAKQWEDIDSRLRMMVAKAPMPVAELATRLGVYQYTVQYHVKGRRRGGPDARWTTKPATGLHIYDGQVYAGTMREWHHYR